MYMATHYAYPSGWLSPTALGMGDIEVIFVRPCLCVCAFVLASLSGLVLRNHEFNFELTQHGNGTHQVGVQCQVYFIF